MQPGADGEIRAAAPTGDLSRRYGVSRATVRNILEVAEAQGLVVPESKGGHVVRCTPRFVELADQWVATDLAWLDFLLHTTLERMAERPSRRVA